MSILFRTTEVIKLNANIIALSNQKGGVGKTTTTVNLGVGLANAGEKVLLVDCDPQASLTISLGYPQPDKLPCTLSTLMGNVMTDEPIIPSEAILHHAEGVDLLPASIELSMLRQVLEPLKKQYDHILIDCMPSLGMLTINALAAANSVIIPVQAQYLPAKGLEQLLKTVSRVQRQINSKLKIDGILLTMVDSRTIGNFPRLMSRLIEIPNVIGVKFTIRDYFELRKTKEVNGGDINLINGPDETLLCGLVMGADGGIGTTYNVMPEWFVKLYDAYTKGDLATAQAYQYKINRVIDALIRHSQFGAIRATKAALQLMGFDVGDACYPAKAFDVDMKAALKKELTELGIEF